MKPTRVFDIIYLQQSRYPKPDSLSAKVNGVWRKYSTQEVISIVNRLSLGLQKMGIGPGDKVAIVANNRPEWIFADYAIQQMGAVSVPMYANITEADYRFIFQDSGAKLAFVSDENLCKRVTAATEGLSNFLGVYAFDELANVKPWTELLAPENADFTALETFKAAVKPDDLFTIIYTSGTTGNPKGVMLTHRNLVSNVLGSMPYVPVNEHHKALSFLPLSHIYERMLTQLYMNAGVSIYFAESLEMIGDNLKEVKPEVFSTVPRLLEKVYDKIVSKGNQLTGLKHKLFFWALELGLKYDTQQYQGAFYNLQLALANKIIFSKWREALGGNIIAIVSGGAALQPRLARVFWSAGIRVMEGYGLTETSPVICVNRHNQDENVIGTVGPKIDNVELKIAADGEILTRGPSVMKGYYNQPELTKEVIDEDGWFHTGDIGEMVEGKYLKITDRKKDMFKTSGGKYIAPQALENKLKEFGMIEQVMVVGAGEKFAGALIVPNFPALKEWAKGQGLAVLSNSELISKPEVIALFKTEVNKLNESFAQYEQVKKIELVSEIWSIETGELTPSLKVKRKVIQSKHKELIESMYR